MANRLRIARLDPTPYQSVADTAPDVALHHKLDALIRRHLPAVTASTLAQPIPAADGRFVEWYSDLAGQPVALAALGEDAQAEARALLADRLNSIAQLADRLGRIDPANAGLADALRQAVSYPGEETVYVVGDEPVLTFWGHRPIATPEPPPSEPPPVVPQSVAPEPAEPGRRVPGWLWLVAGLALLGLIGFGLGRYFDLPWPPWGPDYAKLLQAAKDEEDALKRHLAELEAQLKDGLGRCAAQQALIAARAEEERRQKALAELAETLKNELALCPLKKQLRTAIEDGKDLGRRTDKLASDVKRAIDACRRKEEEAKKKAEEAKRKEEEERRKAEEAKRKADDERKKEEARRLAEKSACVTAEGEIPDMDIYFLQDLTGSFRDDLPNMNRFMADMVGRIERGDFGKNVRVGVGSFTDKPHPVFGSPSHYVFRNHLGLTADPGQLTSTIRGLSTLPAGDEPESQYEAILEMVANAGRIGFRKNARKFVVVLTDAPPHVAGDWPPMPLIGSPRPDDGRGDGNPMDEDYPSAAQTMAALRSADITPVFLVTGSSIGTYQRFVSQFGRGASMPLSSDSSNVMEALLAGLRKACKE